MRSFLADLHHRIVFGTWLGSNLDYDDTLNYVWWAAVMAIAQLSQVRASCLGAPWLAGARCRG